MVPPVAPRALGRLLAQESSLSDLLAYLCELDASGLADALALPSAELRVVREKPTGSGRHGRLDLAVLAAGTGYPVAALELKGAAEVHGDQLEKYEAWADGFDPVPVLFYCHPDGEGPGRSHWTPLRLDAVFSPWCTSSHPQACWLAGQVVEVLQALDLEAERAIGGCTSWYA